MKIKNFFKKWKKPSDDGLKASVKSYLFDENLTVRDIARNLQIDSKKAQKLITEIKTEERVIKALSSSRAYLSGSGNVDIGKYARRAEYFFTPGYGLTRDVNTETLRDWARTSWVRMCVNVIINEVSNLDWNIVPVTDFREEDMIERVENFFKYPNKDEDFKTFLKQYLEDILVLDAGVIIKTFSKDSYDAEKTYTVDRNVWDGGEYKGVEKVTIKKKPLVDSDDVVLKKLSNGESKKNVTLKEMYVADGSTFTIATDPYGRLFEERPTYYQYALSFTSHRSPGITHAASEPIPFWKREVVYTRMHPRSWTPYGFSPIQAMFNTLQLLTGGELFNAKIFEENGTPSGIFNFPGMSDDELRRVRLSYQDNFKGKPHKMMFSNYEGGDNSKGAGFTPIVMSPREMEWLTGMKEFRKIPMAMYNVTPTELGFTDEANKHSSGFQSDIFYRKAILPLVSMIEERFTRDIISEFFPKELYSSCPVRFQFEVEDVFNADRTEALWSQWIADGRRTVNEWRVENGLEPVSWGDSANNRFNPMDSFGENFSSSENEKESVDDKSLKKNVVRDSQDYASFLDDYYKDIEVGLKDFVMSSQMGFVNKDFARKSFSQFVTRLINLLNFKNIKPKLYPILKKDFEKGIVQGEKDSGVQVGFQQDFSNVVNNLVDEQIEGYTTGDGRWFGIQGLNSELQRVVHQTVIDGINEGFSNRKIASSIGDVFEDFRGWKSMRIARTETNRVQNLGRLNAYIKSGLGGKKRWVATSDFRCCDVCNDELDGQVVELTESFVDKKGNQYMIPNVHPNCRCTIEFVVD